MSRLAQTSYFGLWDIIPPPPPPPRVPTSFSHNYTTKRALCALKNSETVYFTSIFSTLSYSDIVPVDNFDLIFFYFYFVFEIFGNNSVSIP